MITFRKVQKQEIPYIQQLAHEIWNENYQEMISQSQIDYMLDKMYSLQQLNEEFESDYHWLFITNGDKVIGYISYKFKENDLFLSKLYIQSHNQGKGYAQESLRYIMHIASEKKCNRVYLTVNKNNQKAIRAYERFGFKLIEAKVFDIGAGYVMDDYIYEYKLSNF